MTHTLLTAKRRIHSMAALGLATRMAGTGVTANAVLPESTLSEGMSASLGKEQAKTGRSIEDVAADFVMQHRPTSLTFEKIAPSCTTVMASLAISSVCPPKRAVSAARPLEWSKGPTYRRYGAAVFRRCTFVLLPQPGGLKLTTALLMDRRR